VKYPNPWREDGHGQNKSVSEILIRVESVCWHACLVERYSAQLWASSTNTLQLCLCRLEVCTVGTGNEMETIVM